MAKKTTTLNYNFSESIRGFLGSQLTCNSKTSEEVVSTVCGRFSRAGI